MKMFILFIMFSEKMKLLLDTILDLKDTRCNKQLFYKTFFTIYDVK